MAQSLQECTIFSTCRKFCLVWIFG